MAGSQGGDVGFSLPDVPWWVPVGIAGATAAGYGVYRMKFSPCVSPAQSLKQKEFLLDRSATLINHGSFGTVPRRIRAKQEQLLVETDTHPDRWFRATVPEKMVQSARAVAQLFNVDDECVGFVTNATTGVNAVLASYPFKSGDQVLITNWAYGAVRNTAEHICRRPDVEMKTVTLQFPIRHEDDVVRQLEATLDDLPNVKVCIVEHITSPTAVVMPIERIVRLCRSRGVRTLVDGAHAPGQLKVDLKQLDPDYYTGNFHKWLFAPRGCAFLYTRKDWLDEMQPCVISWNWKKSYQLRFAGQGTRDETPFIVVPECLKFVDEVLGGQDAMISHNQDLADRATKILAEAWGTEELGMPAHMRAPFMRLVRMPIDDISGGVQEADALNDTLRNKYNIQVAPCFVQGTLYLRLSAQVYNEEKDYHHVAKCILDFKNSRSA